uniref:Uncharacterized protein n=1 Tax=Cacopsylla melanoneura TaxID=428564 RepID=A0A8D8ZXR9_9HEMI
MLDRQIVPPSSMMSPVCIDKQLAAPRKLPKGQGPLFEGAGPKRRLPVVGDWWVASAELLRMSRHDRNPVTALPSSILHGTKIHSHTGVGAAPQVGCSVAEHAAGPRYGLCDDGTRRRNPCSYQNIWLGVSCSIGQSV